jgi:hypothetical protein
MDALYRTVGSYRAGYLYRGSDLNFYLHTKYKPKLDMNHLILEKYIG